MLKINLYCIRACLKNHSRNLHAPLCGIFRPKSPTNCAAHLAESLFQTRSRACLIIKLYTHICPLDPGLAPEVVSQGQCGLWGAHTRKVRSWQRYFLEPESVFLEHQWLCRISPWRWRQWCSERWWLSVFPGKSWGTSWLTAYLVVKNFLSIKVRYMVHYKLSAE